MNRSELDQFARDHHLSESAVRLALDLTGARPDAAGWRAFALRLLNGSGIAAIAAGVILFVTANWQDYGVMGRFGILEAAFVVCVGIALWRPPPDAAGQAALILAMLSTGALLALFGQSYQTGADLYELFFAWSLLALPFAIAGRSGAHWATWWTILNVGLALWSGWLDPNHVVWAWLWDGRTPRSIMYFAVCIVDLAGAALFLYVGRTRFAEHAPRWLVRMLATLGFLFGTVACIHAVLQGGGLSPRAGGSGAQNIAVVAAFAIIGAIVTVATLRSRRDVFPMALTAASWIAISTAFVGQHSGRDMGLFFAVSLWLIATSTAAGFLLMRWVRAWDIGDEAPGAQR